MQLPGVPLSRSPRPQLMAPLCAPGPPVLQLGQNGPGTAAGGLAPAHQAHHVLLQAGDRQVRGVGAADARGAVRAQGEGGRGRRGASRGWVLTAGVTQVIRDILLIGHRQAFTWVDEWCGESLRCPPAPLCAGPPMPPTSLAVHPAPHVPCPPCLVPLGFPPRHTPVLPVHMEPPAPPPCPSPLLQPLSPAL